VPIRRSLHSTFGVHRPTLYVPTSRNLEKWRAPDTRPYLNPMFTALYGLGRGRGGEEWFSTRKTSDITGVATRVRHSVMGIELTVTANRGGKIARRNTLLRYFDPLGAGILGQSPLVPLLFAVFGGLLQLWTGRTVSPFETRIALGRWATLLAVFIVGLVLFRTCVSTAGSVQPWFGSASWWRYLPCLGFYVRGQGLLDFPNQKH
jgi:hypothetical protein